MATSATVARESATRIQSVDIARGIVMVLMGVDHVRVYAGVPAGSPEPGVFLTRWITHFCAPAFVFLAGVSIFLHAQRVRDRGALSGWLIVRGAWLVLLELTVLRLAWTFNTDFAHYMLAGVIWMLGWCMILMAGLVHLPVKANAAIGLAVIAGHNLFGPMMTGGPLTQILYFGGGVSVGSAEENFFVLYSIVPWIGVMAAGYAFASILRSDRRWCYGIGGGAIALFLLLRYFNLYGDRPWNGEPAWMAFLNTTKYPASLLFLLMTLGPVIALMPVFEKARGRAVEWLSVFGRVPMFYYLLHIPLIHLLALGIAAVRTPEAMGWLFGNHPYMPGPPPDGYRWTLALLYATTAVAVAILYFACRWFAGVKARRKSAWLSYL